jgi:hypothetical protein
MVDVMVLVGTTRHYLLHADSLVDKIRDHGDL